MFLIILGGSLALGASLFVAASFTAGSFVSVRTVAAIIGWLFVLATLGCLLGLRQSSFARLTAGAVTFCSGLLLVYVAHFEWTAIRPMPAGRLRGGQAAACGPETDPGTRAQARRGARYERDRRLGESEDRASDQANLCGGIGAVRRYSNRVAAMPALLGKKRCRAARLPRERAPGVLRRAALRRRDLPIAVSTLVPRVKSA